MYPHALSLHVGGLAIHLYGVMMALAFLAGLANWSFLGRREHRDFAFCSDLLFWIMVAGVVGARAAYVIADFAAFRDRPLSMLYVWQGGLIYYGGFLGAGLAILVFARLRRTGVAALFDFVITAVPLAHAFGRIGCFINGCCYGSPTTCALGVYTAGAVRHPTQLYESALNVRGTRSRSSRGHGVGATAADLPSQASPTAHRIVRPKPGFMARLRCCESLP